MKQYIRVSDSIIGVLPVRDYQGRLVFLFRIEDIVPARVIAAAIIQRLRKSEINSRITSSFYDKCSGSFFFELTVLYERDAVRVIQILNPPGSNRGVT